VVPQVKNPFTGQSTIFLYDSYPGGIGFSRKLYEMHRVLLEGSRDLIGACGCEDGCPACVGPAMEVGPGGKRHTLDLISGLLVVASASRGNGAETAQGQNVTAEGDTLNALTD
jgi:DEAD/DEAH box helicase domain-containing protein